jgi:hypothetical protein
MFGPETKRRRLENQKIGDFIVDAKQALHFRLTSDFNSLEDEAHTTKFFGPEFAHQVSTQNNDFNFLAIRARREN